MTIHASCIAWSRLHHRALLMRSRQEGAQKIKPRRAGREVFTSFMEAERVYF